MEDSICEETLYKYLIHGAVADALHDFKGDIQKERSGDTKAPNILDVQNGLRADACKYPTKKGEPDKMWHDEDRLLQSLFKGVEGGIPRFSQMKQLHKHMEEKAGAAGESADRVELEYSISGKNEYTVKYMGNVQANASTISTARWASFFGTDTVNFVVDASVIRLMHIFAEAPLETKNLNINMVINREVINDPATKVYRMPADLKQPNYVNFDFLWDSDPNPISYVPNGDNLTAVADELQRDKFFSKYKFTLGGMTSTDNYKTLPGIVVDIMNDDGTRVFLNNDPHENNSITACIKRILAILKLTGAGSAAKRINAGAHIQCKRSGDWLQLLSCFDILRQYYSHRLKKAVTLREINGRTILVTHDRILLWFGLVMGAEVLYTWKEGDTSEENPENPSGSDTRSKKHVFYFTQSAPETPEQRDKRLVDFASSITVEAVKELLAYSEMFNKENAAYWADVQSGIDKLEETIWNFVKTKKFDTKLYSSTARIVLQAYWRSTFIKLETMPTGEFQKAFEAFQASPSAATASPVVSFYSKLQSCKQLYPDAESIYNYFKAFERDPSYTGIPALFGIVRPGRKSPEEEKIIFIASYLYDKLEDAAYEKLADLLTRIRSNVKEGVYLMDILLPHLAIHIPINIDKSKKDEIVSGANELLDSVLAKTANKDNNELEEIAEKEVVAAPETTEELEKKEQEIKETTGKKKKRNFVKSVIGLGKFFRRTNQKTVAGAGAGNGGGETLYFGSIRLVRMGYLFHLLRVIQGADSEDFDFELFEQLAILVYILLAHIHADNPLAISLLYRYLPTADIFSGPLRSAAETVALQSLDYADADLNEVFEKTPFAVPTVSKKEVDIMLDLYTKFYKNYQQMPFEKRREFLETELMKLIKADADSGKVYAPARNVRNNTRRKNKRRLENRKNLTRKGKLPRLNKIQQGVAAY